VTSQNLAVPTIVVVVSWHYLIKQPMLAFSTCIHPLAATMPFTVAANVIHNRRWSIAGPVQIGSTITMPVRGYSALVTGVVVESALYGLYPY
jgi:hypothetical protein